MRVALKGATEERDALKAKGAELVAAAPGEMNEEQTRDFDAVVAKIQTLNEEISKLTGSISKLEALEAGEPVAPAERAKPKASAVFSAPNVSVAKEHRYSVARAAQRTIAQGKTLDGFEGEWQQELARSGQEPKNGGFLLPLNARLQLRADFTTTQGAGAVQTLVDPTVIEYLRNKMIFQQAGARFLTGLTPGIHKLPRASGTASAAWVTEGNATSASAADVTGALTLTPQTLTAFTDVTRLMLNEASIPSVSEFITSDLVGAVSNYLDYTGFNGTGSSQPTGLLNDSNVTTVAIGTNGGALAWSNLLSLEKTVAEANAEQGRLAYVTSPAGRSTMKSTAKIGSTYPIYLWGDDNTVLGNPAYASMQIPKNLTKGTSSGVCTAVVYGNFEDFIFGIWGDSVEIVEDPYSLSTKGSKRLVALLDAAMGPRHGGSFAKIVDFVF